MDEDLKEIKIKITDRCNGVRKCHHQCLNYSVPYNEVISVRSPCFFRCFLAKSLTKNVSYPTQMFTKLTTFANVNLILSIKLHQWCTRETVQRGLTKTAAEMEKCTSVRETPASRFPLIGSVIHIRNVPVSIDTYPQCPCKYRYIPAMSL